MVARAAPHVALLPIRPKYADAIMSGRKRVEFRRVRFQRDVTHIIVYASSPVKMVVGFFEVAGIEEGSPAAIWKRYRDVGGIEHADYQGYFSNSARAVAIQVGRVCALARPVSLSFLRKRMSPPQGFAYCDGAVLDRIFPCV